MALKVGSTASQPQRVPTTTLPTTEDQRKEYTLAWRRRKDQRDAERGWHLIVLKIATKMAKKEKKKGQGAKKTTAKTEKKALQKLKKELAANGEDDIETLIAQFVEEDRKKLQITEELVGPPSCRSGATLCAHPEKDELLLFGGEYYNGKKTIMYNELFVYNIKKNNWLLVKGPNFPPPRCAHQGP
ncbi:hypothetical protein HPB51_019491 [Rhipicephalus microplus]|uniref:Kelch domain-containing protein 4 n=1 Tax=Rhipicephalus microplus TaxID=6941 RepID=A0A9J6DBC4_RHIMP|nr:hypothetical protein HPB51_019491 [Rhipicephalus microplus]